MRYVDIIHQEGTFCVKSSNDLVNVNITDIHPELILEDNSMIIFDTDETYYNFIGDALLISPVDQNVNMDAILSLETITDTVSGISYRGFDINTISDIKYNDQHIYFIQRTGINSI